MASNLTKQSIFLREFELFVSKEDLGLGLRSWSPLKCRDSIDAGDLSVEIFWVHGQ